MSTIKMPGINLKQPFTRSLCLSAVALALILAACASGLQPISPTPPIGSDSPNSQHSASLPIVALQGFQISLFASSTSSYTHPDSVDVDGDHVFIGYQNVTAKDGTDHKFSTIVEYTMDGKVVKTFSVSGHCDGLRVDPSTHLLWATSNEIANPTMATIDPTSGSITTYTFPRPPHGGGYDDLYFLNGMAFIAASAPTLDKNENNVFPALDKITLSGGKVILTPVLMGNATATDTISNSQVMLYGTSPDSLSVDTKGDLVMVNQPGEIVYLHNPGTPQQQVTRTLVGTQIDDIVWATSTQGRLLIVDRLSGKTYWIRATFERGAVYTEAGFDTSVGNLVGQLDQSTGNITAIAIGFSDPSGLLFVPDGK
jgi:hypothetical protein